MLKNLINFKQLIQEQVHSSWYPIFEPLIHLYFTTLYSIMNKYSGSSYDKYNIMYPDTNEVLRPFRQTINKGIKVIMLFDEPYNNGEATGLPLEVDNEHIALFERSKYQQNIRMFEQLLNVNDIPYSTLDITEWCNQGVLLMNMSFTCEHDKLNNHLTTWLPFTETLLSQILFNNPYSIIVTFSGTVSHSVKKITAALNQNHIIINSPSAFNTQYDYRDFSEYNVLKRINDALTMQSKATIKWI